MNYRKINLETLYFKNFYIKEFNFNEHDKTTNNFKKLELLISGGFFMKNKKNIKDKMVINSTRYYSSLFFKITLNRENNNVKINYEGLNDLDEFIKKHVKDNKLISLDEYNNFYKKKERNNEIMIGIAILLTTIVGGFLIFKYKN